MGKQDSDRETPSQKAGRHEEYRSLFNIWVEIWHRAKDIRGGGGGWWGAECGSLISFKDHRIQQSAQKTAASYTSHGETSEKLRHQCKKAPPVLPTLLVCDMRSTPSRSLQTRRIQAEVIKTKDQRLKIKTKNREHCQQTKSRRGCWPKQTHASTRGDSTSVRDNLEMWRPTDRAPPPLHQVRGGQ